MTTLQQLGFVGPHLVRYGTAADQKYLLNEFRDTYDHLVVNATMLAHMKAALSVFLTQKAKKPYFIDPQTHAFQHEITFLQSEQGELKRPVKKLIEAYGDPVATRVQNSEAVLPEDFDDDTVRAEFCRKVIDYQRRAVTQETQSGPDAKFLQFIAKKKGTPLAQYPPNLVVAPYFFMTAGTFAAWCDTNVALVRDSKKIVNGDLPVAAQIVISKDLLANGNLRSRLITAYGESGADVFLLWIDAFTEQEVGESILRAYLALLRELGKTAAVVSLFGGFFSTMVCKSQLASRLIGVCHSLEYGESRAVIPVGGGVPVAKFYLKALHERLNFRDALRAVKALDGFKSVVQYSAAVCDCPECQSIITQNPEIEFNQYGRTNPVAAKRKGQTTILQYPTAQTKEHCVRHYMWSKRNEWAGASDTKAIAAELTEAASKLKRALGLDFVAHAEAWAQILTNPAS